MTDQEPIAKTETPAHSSHRGKLDRLSWWLWALTFSVVVALAAAVPLLYLPLLRTIEQYDGTHNAAPPLESYYAVVGLAGLVLIFCLYVTLKQAELNRMRRALSAE